MIFLILFLIFVIRKDIAFNDYKTYGFCIGFMIVGGLELLIQLMWLASIT